MSLASLTICNPRDFSLAVLICVAEGDERECPWYTVFNRVLTDFIFVDCDGERCICSITPQYSLVAKYDTGHSPELDAIEECTVSAINAPLLHSPSSKTPSDVIMHSPTDHSDSAYAFPLTPFCSGQLNAGSPLSPIAGESPHVMNPNLNDVDHNIPIQPQTPIRAKFFDGDSPLTPLSESGTAAATASHFLPTVSVPVSPTPPTRKSTVQPPAVPSELRRSVRQTRGPVFPVQRTPSEIPETPPKDRKSLIRKSTRIPDFIAALHQIPTSCPPAKAFPTEFEVLGNDRKITTRTILIVEIKSALSYRADTWNRIWQSQVQAQARHTFKSHTDLDCLGVIIAVGRRWVYFNVHRPPPDGLTYSQKRDPDYMPPSEDWSDTSSDVTSDIVDSSQNCDVPGQIGSPLVPSAPEFISSHPKYVPWRAYIESCLLDKEGQSESFFGEVLKDLRKHNQSIWK